MTLQINLDQSEITLKLLKNKASVDLQTTKYYHNLSEMLINTLDNLLKRNRVDPIRHIRYNELRRGQKAMSNGVNIKAIRTYKILGNLGADSTSYKIAAAFVGALKFRDRS